MTVAQLIEALQALSEAQKSAQAVVVLNDQDDDQYTDTVTDVRYEWGEVQIVTDSTDGE